MCGISGFIDNNSSSSESHTLLLNMLKSISHRGPEASAIWQEAPVHLGHNRLKIIDLSDEANQPFEYEHIVLVFNGEVYNYIELRKELLAAGYKFRTSGDSEVICAAYIQWGKTCVTRMVGMWAFALWDKKLNQLFCSRDRFGIKPFYYIQSSGKFYFSSEYKALKLAPIFSGKVNIDQLHRGIQMGWSSYYNETFFDCIHLLEPAHNLIYNSGNIIIEKYWDIDFEQPKSNLTSEEKQLKFYTLFEDAVRLHARSDVPNGTCLSGGLDSSAISAMYCRLLPQTNIKSFTVYYEGENAVDERPFVKEVVRKYPNILPHYYTPTDSEISESFHRIASMSDTPVLGSAYISHYFLMKLAKMQGVTVVIDGQGSDEYLGGYLHSFYRVVGDQLRQFNLQGAHKLMNRLGEREGFNHSKKVSFWIKSLASAIMNENGLYNTEYKAVNNVLNIKAKELCFADATSNRFDNFLYHILMHTTLQTLLHFEDRNSMAFSLESRVPFLDHRLAEFAFTLQREDRINNNAETKYILRESLKPILPDAVYNRKDKKGFVTPGEIKWLNGPLSFLLEMDYSLWDSVNSNRVKQLVANYKKGDTSKAALVWRLATTNYWLKHFA